MTADPSWPEPGFVWGGILGACLGRLRVLNWVSVADPGARESSRRPRLPERVVGIEGGLIAFVIWSTVYTSDDHGLRRSRIPLGDDLWRDP